MVLIYATRFLLYFGISFFLLSIPIRQRPVFYYIYQNSAKSIAWVTGISGYTPTYHVDKTSLQQAGVKK